MSLHTVTTHRLYIKHELCVTCRLLVMSCQSWVVKLPLQHRILIEETIHLWGWDFDFKVYFYLLNYRITERGRQRQMYLPLGSLPQMAKRSGVGQAETRSHELYLCLPGKFRAISCSFPMHISQQAVWKWAARTHTSAFMCGSSVTCSTTMLVWDF